MSEKHFPYGKYVLITGGTSGIGLSCARKFASYGYSVYAVSRSAGERSEKCGDGLISYKKCDVSDLDSIKALYKETGSVGTVVHCAGFGIAGSAEDTPVSDAARQIDVNYLGVIRVNSVYLPGMRSNGGGIVVVVSSVAGIVSIPFQSHYSSSKFALEAYAEALRNEAGPFGIKVTVVEPGDTRTGFTNGRKMCIPDGSPYGQMCTASVKKMEQDELHGGAPEACASVIFKNSRKKNPPVKTVIGLKYKLLSFGIKILPSRLRVFVVGKLYCPRV